MKTKAPRSTRALLLFLGAPAFGCAAAAPADRLVLEPVADATLFAESGARADGAGAFVFVGCNGAGDARRALVRFDLDRVGKGARITGAVLQLSMDHTSSGETPVRLYRVLEGWSEGPADAQGMGQGAAAEARDVTWTQRSLSGPAWSTPGGALAEAPSAEVVVGDPGIYAWFSPRLLEEVQGWIDDPESNHGWAVVGLEPSTGTAKRFISREHPNSGVRPRLSLMIGER